MDAVYARQSVDKKDSLSIGMQIDLCTRPIDGAYKVYQDRGYSGKNTNRPAFEQLMRDVEKESISKIYVYRLDRFSRSIADFGRIWEVLRKHNVEFVSINETFDTSSPMGRAMLNIIMVFAQLERETIAERVRDNYYQRAGLGAWPGGPPPYGFSIGRLPDAAGKHIPTLMPNEHQATVKRIFAAYAEEGASLGSVARVLNGANLPAPKRATWDNVTLSRLLHSPLYVTADEDIYLYYKGKGMIFSNAMEEFDSLHGGMVVGKRNRTANKYNDLTDQHFSLANHFGLIPSDLWLLCQYKLEGNRQLGGNGRGKHTWLSGLLKCGSCGYSVKVNKDGDKFYLVCSGRSNLSLCAQRIRIDLRALEQTIAADLETLLSECPPIAKADDPISRASADILVKIDQKIVRLMAALAESTALSMDYINRELARLDKERTELVQRQATQNTPPRRAVLGHLVFHTLAFEEKKLVAAQFIKQVRLTDETAEIAWAI